MKIRILISVLLALVLLVEWVLTSRTRRFRLDRRELFCNLASHLVNRALNVVAVGWLLMVLESSSRLAPFSIPSGPWDFLLTFLAVDFFYYWEHRLLHTRVFWPFHAVHHSGETFNFTTSLRLSWFNPAIAPFFFAPLALLGFAPAWIAISLGLNLVYQFFLHTQWVPALGPLEGTFNTPSAHRVHHGRNELYLDKNFGGVLVIWDRCFGTYQPETEKVRFGVTSGPSPYNPVLAQLQPFATWRKGLASLSIALVLFGAGSARAVEPGEGPTLTFAQYRELYLQAMQEAAAPHAWGIEEIDPSAIHSAEPPPPRGRAVPPREEDWSQLAAVLAPVER